MSIKVKINNDWVDTNIQAVRGVNHVNSEDVYTKQESDALFSGKVSKTDIVQSTGTSTTSVMSQKAISDALSKKADQTNSKQTIRADVTWTNNIYLGDEAYELSFNRINGDLTYNGDKVMVGSTVSNEVSLVQNTGQSTTSVISQKAVTDALSTKADKTELDSYATKEYVQTNAPQETKESIEEKLGAWLEEDGGESDGEVYTKAESDALLSGKVSKADIVQSTGTSTTSVMSQKAVSEISNKVDELESNETIIPADETTSIYPNDLDFSDANNNIIVEFRNGHIRTKNFDSKYAGQKLHELEPFSHKDAKEADFDVVDDDGNVIFSIIQGWLKTKNFSGKHVYDVLNNIGIQEWCEQWSRMPKTENDNPLAKIRFDGGMCRIFRKWGFIGDSLCSGTINGYVVSLLEYTPITNKAISNGAIVDDDTSVISNNVTLVGRYPSIKLIFENNSGLSGKVLLASYSNGTYTPLITGSNAKEYTNIYIPNNSVIAISYPNNNIPRVLLSVDGTQLANYEMSWGQQLVRLLGAEGYNFSVGGEYAKRWCQGSGGTGSRNWDRAQQTEYLKDAYIIGLGVNDASYWMSGQTTIVDYPCVTAYPNQSDYVDGLVLTDNDIMNDIDVFDYNNNANSFAGWYAGVIQRIKSVRKDAYIFCCTLPAAKNNNAYSQVIRKIVEKLNTHYKEGTIWLLDLARFNPITTEMAQYIKNDSHLTAFGYLYSAYQITSYIDWIIRHNIQKFKDVPFIGTNIVSEIFDESKINE